MPQRQQDTWSNEESPSKSACSLLRPYRVQLIERMGLTQALSLTDRLYQMHIISHSEMETVQNCSWPTYGGGTAPRRLLSLLEGRTWDNIKDFARLLQKTEGLTDIGDALLCRVASTETPSSNRSKELQSYSCGEVKMKDPKTVAVQVMETAVRLQLQKFQKDRQYEDKHTVRWKSLPRLSQNKMWTKNRVAALGDMIVCGYCGGHDLYALDDSKEGWVTQKGFHGAIWTVSSYQNKCYVTAGNEDRKVYQLQWDTGPRPATWHHIADIPAHLQDGGCFSPVTINDRMYMFGGLMDDQPLDTAVVYDMNCDKWLSLPKLTFKSFNCSAALIDNTIYVAGGRTKDSSGNVRAISEVISLRLNESSWRKHPILEYGNATLTALHDKLIATGGMSNGDDVNKVYVFDFISKQWMPLPDMTVARSNHGVCVTGNYSLATVGGRFNTNSEILTVH